MLFGDVTQRGEGQQTGLVSTDNTQTHTQTEQPAGLVSECYQTDCHVSASSSAMNQQHTER